MKNDFQGARKQFESALSEKYPAAQIDLADLLANPSAGMLDTARAATLYEGAWREHVSIAAFRLGQLYESRDAARALSWYVKGAETGEPYALAYLADREEKQALSLADTTSRNQMLLHALSRYATAAQTAHDQDWPLDAWKAWRYRRATLARELKEQGMMQQVADTTAAVFSQRGRPAATALNRVKTLFK